MTISTKKAEIERQMAQLEKELKNLENSAAFRKEAAVTRALNNLMRKHGYSKSDLIAILQPSSSVSAKHSKKRTVATNRKPKVAKKRKPRKLKIFKNPNTGETVKTRGGNHKVLKAWKADYKLTSIEEWLVETRD